MRHIAGERFEVFSAGIDPTELNPLAIKVMREIGMDISNQKSKSLDVFLDKKLDYVITVCDNAKKICPAFSGKHKNIHWDIEDPAKAKGTEDEKLDFFRRIRDEIKKRGTEWQKKY